MFTFYEWLKKKNIVEMMGRHAAMTPEEYPDITPQYGNFVIIMDKDRNAITNDNVFRVLNMRTPQDTIDADNVELLRWQGGKGLIKMEKPTLVPRGLWKNFVIVNEFLYPKEKSQGFENQPVFMVGLNTQSWINMRRKEIAARKRKELAKSPGVTTPAAPAEIPASQLQAIKQQLIGSKEEEENDPEKIAKARTLAWLRGG